MRTTTRVKYINKKIIILPMNEKLAELYGAMIGDGCLSKYYSNYRKRNEVCFMITGHTHDEPYHRNVLQPILIKNFGIRGYIWLRKKYNAVLFSTSNKEVFNFFKKLGFPIGLKGDKLKIPKSFLLNNKLSIAWVRGIFDTDGTVYNRYSKKYKNNYQKYTYKNIQFHMKSKKVIYQIKKILEKNSIKTGKIFDKKGYFGLRIYEQSAVKRFFNIIKPSNNYHKERFLNLQ